MPYPSNQANPAGAIPVWFAPAPVPVGSGAFSEYDQIDLTDGLVHTLAAPAGTTSIVVATEGGNARYLVGVDPDADTGMPVWGTTEKVFANVDARFIQMTGSTGTLLNVLYQGMTP